MTCQRKGCLSPVAAKDLGRPRKYCGDRCRIAVAKGIELPASVIVPMPIENTAAWWVPFQHDRAGFTAIVEARRPMLAMKYGSAPVSTVPSKLEQTFMDRPGQKARVV